MRHAWSAPQYKERITEFPTKATSPETRDVASRGHVYSEETALAWAGVPALGGVGVLVIQLLRTCICIFAGALNG